MACRICRLMVVLLVVAMPLSAWADDPIAAAILNLEGRDVDPEMTETLTSIVRNEALQVDKYQVINEYPIKLADILVMLGCSAESPSCLKQIAREVNARVLIYGTVTQRDSSYNIALNIFDADTGRMLNRLTRTLSDTSDPVIGFRKEIEAFFEEERGESLTRLQIGSNVEGAQIRLEETFVGVVPLERKGLPPGEYHVQVAHPDYEVWQQTVTLEAGADERVWAQLQPLKTAADETATAASTAPEVAAVEQPDIAESDTPERVPTTNWGAWSAIVVGGAGLAGSIGFGIALKNVERTLEAEAASGTLTESRYEELFNRGENYELAHRVLLGVGAVAVVTGVVWLIIDSSSESTASVGVGVDGVRARVQW